MIRKTIKVTTNNKNILKYTNMIWQYDILTNMNNKWYDIIR